MAGSFIRSWMTIGQRIAAPVPPSVVVQARWDVEDLVGPELASVRGSGCLAECRYVAISVRPAAGCADLLRPGQRTPPAVVPDGARVADSGEEMSSERKFRR